MIRLHRYLFLAGCVLAILLPSILCIDHIIKFPIVIDQPIRLSGAGISTFKAVVEEVIRNSIDQPF
ncbi:hypothetical protein CKO36_09660 [Rhabdochromatium marinum]|nr:hypothetical protein [Rhabdochromatium marinum]